MLYVSIFRSTVMSISSGLNVLEFAHLEKAFGIDLDYGFIEVGLRDACLREGRSSGVPSRVVQGQGLRSFPQNIVLSSQGLFCVLAVVVRNHVSHWGSRPVWSAVWVLLFWQVNLRLRKVLIKSW